MRTAEGGGVPGEARACDPAELLMASDVLVPVDTLDATHPARIGSLERAVRMARAKRCHPHLAAYAD